MAQEVLLLLCQRFFCCDSQEFCYTKLLKETEALITARKNSPLSILILRSCSKKLQKKVVAYNYVIIIIIIISLINTVDKTQP